MMDVKSDFMLELTSCKNFTFIIIICDSTMRSIYFEKMRNNIYFSNLFFYDAQ